MTLPVEAVYENGVLKPTRPLPLKEHEAETLERLARDPEFGAPESS